MGPVPEKLSEEMASMIKSEELTNPKSCMNRALDYEMTFVLLGRDPAAPVAIRAWVAERIRLGKNDAYDAQIIEALHCANCMYDIRKGIGFDVSKTVR